jgi:glycosyltransferase involved in cell wall biosynthesis
MRPHHWKLAVTVPPMARERITIIIPVLNETANIATLANRIVAVVQTLGIDWEVLFVDDGSSDDTLARIRALHNADRRFTAISLSRNFGKEIALAAGLAHARGDAAILMDADLQHPPETLAAFVARWREGYQVVYGQRLDRRTDGPTRRWLSRIYYKLYNALAKTDIPEGAGDFRLLDRKAIDAMNQLRETSRFNKGLFSWIGFRSIGVPYEVAPRSAGASRWQLRKLISFALDGITSFSTLPLRISSLLGLAISLTAFGYVIVFLAKTMVFGIDLPGFPTLVISVMLLSGVQLIVLGVIGEYLGRVYQEVKRRPLFLVADEVGLETPARLESRERRVSVEVGERP